MRKGLEHHVNLTESERTTFDVDLADNSVSDNVANSEEFIQLKQLVLFKY